MRYFRADINGRITIFANYENQLISIPKLLGIKNDNFDLKDIFGMEDEIVKKIEKGNYSQEHLDNIKYAPAVGNPGKIICVGLNYVAHIEETKKEKPLYPVLFSKFSNSLAGHLEDIPIPEKDLKVDYEGELGVMIGRRAYKVSPKIAMEHVFGYFVGNDVSSRELQYRTSQYLLGKTLDKFFPNGPYLVTKDDIPNPQDLKITTHVNGELRQNSSTSKMIFSISTLISYISSFMPLETGDIISTGTPDMVIMGMPESQRKWLKDGDIVRVTIEKIGALENKFVI